MSEKEKTEWELKKEDRELLRQTIDTIKAGKPTEPPSPNAPNTPPEPMSNEGGHKSHNTIEDLLTCPDCYPQIEKAVISKMHESRKDKPTVCVNCGLGVDETEDSCPWCGGKDAKAKE